MRCQLDLLVLPLGGSVLACDEAVSGVQTRAGPKELRAGIDHLLKTFSAHRELAVAYLEALLRAQRSPGLRNTMTADFDALRVALASGIKDLQAKEAPSRRVDSEMAATLLMATFDGLLMQWLLDPGRLPSGRTIAETLLRSARFVIPAGRPKRVPASVGAR